MKRLFILALGFAFLGFTSCKEDTPVSEAFDDDLVKLLESVSDSTGLAYFMMPASNDLASIPQDPNNPLTEAKVELGKMLYHETAISIHSKHEETMGTYSCASCHFAQGGFAACKTQGIGDGGYGFGETGEGRQKAPIVSEAEVDVQPIKTPSSMNDAYQTVTLWNGSLGGVDINLGTEGQWTPGSPLETNTMGYHGLETQAIAGIKVHRLGIDPTFIDTTAYKGLFDAAFPDIDESERYTRKYAGLAIAAYERILLANESPFQKWVAGDKDAMTNHEKEGAMLFFGKAGCVACHTGPALSSMTFYGYGMNDLSSASDVFRPDATSSANLGRGGFTGKSSEMFQFKTPQLYNLADSPFYGHGSSFHSIKEVVQYKNNGMPQNDQVVAGNLAELFVPLHLDEYEVDRLTDFLKTGLRDNNLMRYTPSQLPSGNCFPNNDDLSKSELGCE